MSGRYSRASLTAGRKQPRSAPIKRINALWNTTVTTLPHVCGRLHSFEGGGGDWSLFGLLNVLCIKYLCARGGAASAEFVSWFSVFCHGF
jgi:hypothetical protein